MPTLSSTLVSTVQPLLAHQGGWDEILLVAGPIAVIVALLVVVKRRVDAATADRSGDSSASPANGSASVGPGGDAFDSSPDSA